MFLLKVGANDTSYLQLREWVDKLNIRLVIPEVVYLEWKQQQLDSLKKSYSRIGDDFYIISQLTSEARKEWIVPTDDFIIDLDSNDEKYLDMLKITLRFLRTLLLREGFYLPRPIFSGKFNQCLDLIQQKSKMCMQGLEVSD